MDGLGSRYGDLEAAVRSCTKDKAANELHVDNQNMLLQKIESLKEDLKVAVKHKDRHKHVWDRLYSESMPPTASPMK